jgi:hypothetical protein
MAADPQRHMSVEEYLELDRNSLDVKYEYIDGVAYEVRNPQALAGGSAMGANLRGKEVEGASRSVIQSRQRPTP